MHTNEPREVEGIELGYDPRDIDPKGITRGVIYFFIFTLVFFGIGALWWVYVGQVKNISVMDTRKPKISGPLVQGNVESKIDIMAMRQDERRRMTTYGVTKDNKLQIPVDRAIELISQRNLPDISSSEPAKSPGTTIQQNAVAPGTAAAPEVSATP